MQKPYFTRKELQDLGFTYQGLTAAEDFQYDWWVLNLHWLVLSITFEYELNAKVPYKCFAELDDSVVPDSTTKDQLLQLIHLLKTLCG
ncbi:hypothetical protein [Chryseobacterium sp. MFBS3-17]|uniref:hypothetical protein n=1 Tax=Chryseobacterium sp. MFBS3-17 TaxID=2886689 RepID=UPI001D0DFDD9|nr:hypothetical protein [Chryseobacterium sp. MFBS3-17]MCC2590341.1 hypothetical protein [Chryseobacterium sp. MFBS3-17]